MLVGLFAGSAGGTQFGSGPPCRRRSSSEPTGITSDKKLRTKPVEIRALWEHWLRVFCIGGKKDLTTWEWLARVVKYGARMEELIEQRGPGPWIYMLNEGTVDEFVPKWAAGQQ